MDAPTFADTISNLHTLVLLQRSVSEKSNYISIQRKEGKSRWLT